MKNIILNTFIISVFSFSVCKVTGAENKSSNRYALKRRPPSAAATRPEKSSHKRHILHRSKNIDYTTRSIRDFTGHNR